MISKSQHTTQFILETVAPIFNKNGYAATSLSDLTKATGLTKGAIYGNFKNKEELAIAAYKYNIKIVMSAISKYIEQEDSPIKKLFLIVDFYRNYFQFTSKMGGCPVINVGVDANNQNQKLLEKVRHVIERIQGQLATIIEDGIEANEISSEINVMQYSKRIDTMIQGAIFMAHTMNDNYYIKDTMDQIDQMIINQMKA
ncbi:TetR/AcrR family transcriptional regulator [Olleya sp. R77988]|uniref:TetR/AcrR family transcriptional regulator n=1 Tax=Olleya sp. R77988 TaxID=3093875 RepID=UPI0037C9DBE4